MTDGFYCGSSEGTLLVWYLPRFGMINIPVDPNGYNKRGFSGLWRHVGFHIRGGKVDFKSIKPRRKLTQAAKSSDSEGTNA